MYELIITEFAEQDLDGIVEYIAAKLANPPAAGTFLDNVEACYGSLGRTPRMFSECEDTYLKRKGYRKALINNYLLNGKLMMNPYGPVLIAAPAILAAVASLMRRRPVKGTLPAVAFCRRVLI